METARAGDVPEHPTLAEATAVWARIGLMSFGGPAGQIALMHRELVERRRWISDARFLHALNFCMLLPGPEAQQLATYVGWLLHGTRGGLVAGTLFVLPGFLVLLALSTAYVAFHGTTWLPGLFFGLKAAVLAVVVEALLRIARRALKTRAATAIAVVSFLAIAAFAVPFPVIVLGAGLVGLVGARIAPAAFPAGGHGGAGASDDGVVDRKAEAARPTAGRVVGTVLLGAAAWAAPAVLAALILGPDTVLVPIAAFFSKMAVVTFGGAYAVLAYVAQQAVEAYGWLKPGEMIDGLALAETTPGPLVLVLTFVGYLAGFRDPGPLAPYAAAFLGAAMTTWVTFVPCFLWIFLGAPHVERLRRGGVAAAALAAVTAAVVGVIANLTLWFALHVLFRSVETLRAGPLVVAVPDPASVDPAAVALSVVAFVALFGFRVGLVPTLVLCGAAGLVLRLALPA
ncbi:chromate efflux transporter [Oharaeibacter diazotrophicus]|uniref:Chromate transporter n=3 Tax=Oharaeibacter diazotrophicus TaxID=1920512 RepID=A0A4R6R8H9_9HYPH|nr:chromate efflux transporter [Oharaeibacter diazotrophicus]TDP82331.1 chromate transporter [Oharaeibacter diazotrophicus]BBE72906.1 chromate transport protein [Pleomorphomonas sp. SM30]GLS76944.1 chromate transporter [Oharaeibacter diazotrophicus]